MHSFGIIVQIHLHLYFYFSLEMTFSFFFHNQRKTEIFFLSQRYLCEISRIYQCKEGLIDCFIGQELIRIQGNQDLHKRILYTFRRLFFLNVNLFKEDSLLFFILLYSPFYILFAELYFSGDFSS